MTDVNIAVELLGDAQDDAFDTAIVVSGDSDLTKPVQAVQARDPAKRVVVAFPPKRTSVQLRQAAAAGFVIGRKKLQDSQLPDRVVKSDGAGGLLIYNPHQLRRARLHRGSASSWKVPWR